MLNDCTNPHGGADRLVLFNTQCKNVLKSYGVHLEARTQRAAIGLLLASNSGCEQVFVIWSNEMSYLQFDKMTKSPF